MFTGSEVIRAVEKCPFGNCRKSHAIVIDTQPTIYRNPGGEIYYRAQGYIGGSPLQGTHMVPESVKNDPYEAKNLEFLKVRIFGNARINSDDIQVGCATSSC